MVTKTTKSSENGIHIVFENLPPGGSTSRLDRFQQVTDQLKNTRLVYVGETHDSMADHRLQLRVIEALYRQNPNLAIGMEMFPASVQPVLDQYTIANSDMSEQEFLKKSGYYSVWGYDFRLFCDIFQFARRHHLPVIGLNLDRRIVSSVFKSGNTDSLDTNARKEMAADRDLTLDGYTDGLEYIHSQHREEGQASGGISGFVQAQGLWDETMAEHISNYLRDHPANRMVVLAGIQHTRKDFGIPPRVERRLSVPQASLVNIYDQRGENDLARVADYYFLADSIPLVETPLMGVVLEPLTTSTGAPYLQITRLIEHSKAKEAGLLPRDILKEIDHQKIETMDDVKIVMLGKQAGDTAQVTIGRTEDGLEKNISLTVSLSAPPPHSKMIAAP